MVSEAEVRTATLMMFLGALGIAALAYATVADNVPSMLSPYSLTVVLPSFDIGVLGAVGAWPIGFLLWGIPLFSKACAIPRWSALLAATAWALGLVWFVIGARTGVVHQGLVHVCALAAQNAFLGGLLFWVYQRGSRQPTFATNFAFHWLIVAWLAWGAFPWLGEGP